MGFFCGRLTGILLFVFLWFLSVTVRESTASGGFPIPKSCKSLECPSYDVVFSGKDFEIRKYKKALWISSPPIKSNSFEAAVKQAFGPLYSYIEGNNDRKAKVGMTAPVIVDISPFAGTFVARFYLRNRYQKNPPGSKKVRLQIWPGPQYAAVRRFGGLLIDDIIPIQASILRDSIRGTPFEPAIVGRPGGPTTYTIAGYDSPYERANRTNEVMFLF